MSGGAEVWMPVPGWDGLYEVSNLGHVRSLLRSYATAFGIRPSGGRDLKIFMAATGYAAVNFTAPGGARKQFLVHSLVLSAFVCSRPNGMEACHGDGNRMNPCLSNLRWDTRSRNHADKIIHGTAQRGEKHGNAKLTDADVFQIRSQRMTSKEAAKLFGVCRSTIKKILSGGSWRHVIV